MQLEALSFAHHILPLLFALLARLDPLHVPCIADRRFNCCRETAEMCRGMSGRITSTFRKN
eukprot:7294403-Prymnesium_polylepis.1